MLEGFNQHTEPLTDYERNILLPVIAKGLSLRVGAKRAVRNKEIVSAMRRAGYDLNDARLRKIINHIRCCGYVKCLVATSKGYYVATSPAEMESYITSLGGREGAIRTVREAIERDGCSNQEVRLCCDCWLYPCFTGIENMSSNLALTCQKWHRREDAS